MARLIARRPPIATRLIIQAVDDGLNTDIDRGLEAEARAFMEVLRTEDAAEGVQAFFQRREPMFKGR
jgi:enoyl-CoA hydratase